MSNYFPEVKNLSDTPISDSTPHTVGDLAMVCRRLERKLAATRKYLSEVSERSKRMEEAGDMMVQHFYTDEPRSEMWDKAKEAK